MEFTLNWRRNPKISRTSGESRLRLGGDAAVHRGEGRVDQLHDLRGVLRPRLPEMTPLSAKPPPIARLTYTIFMFGLLGYLRQRPLPKELRDTAERKR